MDERFVAVYIRDKGIVVFTACSHAGVVYVPRRARYDARKPVRSPVDPMSVPGHQRKSQIPFLMSVMPTKAEVASLLRG